MEKEEKKYTWADLKEFCNTLNEKQLAYPVRWVGEERGGPVINAEPMGEDHIVTDYGAEPISAYKDDEEMMEDPQIAFHADEPVLWVD